MRPGIDVRRPDGPGGGRPEGRGALVLSGAQDDDLAWESLDERGQAHGAFTLAPLRAMRRSAPDESSEETFDRARALLRVTTRYQEPVVAGTEVVGIDSPARGEPVDSQRE